jgi:hypothetical protein
LGDRPVPDLTPEGAFRLDSMLPSRE